MYVIKTAMYRDRSECSPHSPDHAIGQLARYMGWVKETIGKERKINGVIVAKEIGTNLRYAVSVMPNVTPFEYEIEFHLRRSPSDR